MDSLKVKSDGCTFFPEGNYVSCCEIHDAAYGAGYDRAKADEDLRECVKSCGRPVQAWVMWVGVRLFGYYRWKRGHRRVRLMLEEENQQHGENNV
jgi:hypothetical protein